MPDDIVYVDALRDCPTGKNPENGAASPLRIVRLQYSRQLLEDVSAQHRHSSRAWRQLHASIASGCETRLWRPAVRRLASESSPFCREKLSLTPGARLDQDGHELPWPKAALRIPSTPSRDRTSCRTCGAHAVGGVRVRRPCGCHPNGRAPS